MFVIPDLLNGRNLQRRCFIGHCMCEKLYIVSFYLFRYSKSILLVKVEYLIQTARNVSSMILDNEKGQIVFSKWFANHEKLWLLECSIKFRSLSVLFYPYLHPSTLPHSQCSCYCRVKFPIPFPLLLSLVYSNLVCMDKLVSWDEQ